MYVKPIPKNLLIHNIVYEENAGKSDGWDDEYLSPVDINFVRLQPISKFKRSTNSEGKESNTMLFVDYVNSSSFPDFKHNSKIKHDGETYIINEVQKLYATKDHPHHYEIGLR